MPQLRIPFGLDTKKPLNPLNQLEPIAKWNNILLIGCADWKVAFVEVDGNSYGDLLRPNKNYRIEMGLKPDIKKPTNLDYQLPSLLIDNQIVYQTVNYFQAWIVISTVTDNVNANNFITMV
jgi:hypothetical protein